MKMGGGGYRPVLECNLHSWCSVGVKTSPFFSVYTVYIYIYIYGACALRAAYLRLKTHNQNK